MGSHRPSPAAVIATLIPLLAGCKSQSRPGGNGVVNVSIDLNKIARSVTRSARIDRPSCPAAWST